MKKLAIFGLIAAVVLGIFLAQRRRAALSTGEPEMGHVRPDDLVAAAS